jgi:nitrogen fixation/metabolism regulation signal transduction histidine kinase
MSQRMFKLINKITERLELRSIESILTLFIGSCLLVLSGLMGFILWYSSASILVVCTVLVLFLCPFALLCWYVRRALLNPYYRFSAVLEAIRNEDYSLRANPKFNQGAVKLLADEITIMTADLQSRKSQYDQQAVLVLRLIEQLATPIVILNKEHKLHHANEAFSNWRKQPWQTLRHTYADDLGFTSVENKWQLRDESLIAKWQLRHSQFTMQEQSYQLLVLTNIEQVVYHTEQVAWQKMTRVLSHEINNSLSPIKSLAQTLQDMLKGNDDFANLDPALQVIVERSDGLMQFVNRYANLSKQFDVHIEQCEIAPLLQSVSNLFDYPIEIKCDALFVLADKVLLEQVLVNLVKNAIEASKSQQLIELNAYELGNQMVIEVKDSGSGIQNTDNLFVPFYTTKAQGKGIGLNLCRNMIEQQGAKLTLSNREDKTGAVAQCRFNI